MRQTVRLIETLTTCVAATLAGPVAYVPIPRAPVEVARELPEERL